MNAEFIVSLSHSCSIKSWLVVTLWHFLLAVEMELNSFSAQSILARSMADKSIDDIEPLVSATKKMCFTSFFLWRSPSRERSCLRVSGFGMCVAVWHIPPWLLENGIELLMNMHDITFHIFQKRNLYTYHIP